MNWITKIIKAGEKIKTAFHERASKEDIAKSDWTSCCRGPILKKDLEQNLWVCPDCNKHHRIKPSQRFDILFGKNNYEVFKTPIPKDDPLNWTDSKPYKERLKAARKKTGMECGMMVVCGTINNIKEIIKIAKSVGAITIIDAAQSALHMPLDVIDLDCDFLTFSGHKMLGPTGIGVLYGKKEILEAMPPYQKGGDMILEVTFDKSTWNEIPFKFEAGTPNIAGAIGLSAAVKYLMEIGMQNIREHEIEITKYAYSNLMNINGIEILGPENIDIRAGLISFNIPDIHPHDLGTFLDSKGIAIRTGHHCAMPLIKKLGSHSSARASFYIYNTNQEIDKFTTEINNSIKYFNNV